MKPDLDGSIFSLASRDALRLYLADCTTWTPIDVDRAYASTVRAMTNRKNGKLLRGDPLDALEARWYESVAAGSPDYGVYSDTYYVCDAWACWARYSRKYLRAIASEKSLGGRSIVEDIGATESVLDLGCGMGYTTAALVELFPEADVYGTNIDGSAQFAIAFELSLKRGFTLRTDFYGIRADVVFASEYFEHFAEPVAHLVQVLACVRPRVLIVANTFTSPAIGHFDEYRINGVRYPGSSVPRRFNETLREHGYEKVETKLWNSRPTYWRLRA